MVKVKAIWIIPELDGCIFDRNTYPYLWIDPLQRTCGVEIASRFDPVPANVRSGRILRYQLDARRRNVDVDELRWLLRSWTGQALLNRICDGWDEDWKDGAMRGRLTDDAIPAVAQLFGEISNLHSVLYRELHMEASFLG